MIHHERPPTVEALTAAIDEYVGWWNNHRVHTRIEGLSRCNTELRPSRLSIYLRVQHSGATSLRRAPITHLGAGKTRGDFSLFGIRANKSATHSLTCQIWLNDDDDVRDNRTGEPFRVVVFGASGRTGMRVIEQALAHGYTVRAVCRSGRPRVDHSPTPEVEWQPVDVTVIAEVANAVAGMDAVISAVGAGISRSETLVYSKGVRNMIAAMRADGVKRLAVVSALPVGPARGAKDRFLRRLLWVFFGPSYRDMTRMEQELAKVRDVRWACVRPPYLRDRPATGHYAINAKSRISGGSSMTTGDLACALLDQVSSPQDDSVFGGVVYAASVASTEHA